MPRQSRSVTRGDADLIPGESGQPAIAARFHAARVNHARGQSISQSADGIGSDSSMNDTPGAKLCETVRIPR